MTLTIIRHPSWSLRCLHFSAGWVIIVSNLSPNVRSLLKRIDTDDARILPLIVIDYSPSLSCGAGENCTWESCWLQGGGVTDSLLPLETLSSCGTRKNVINGRSFKIDFTAALHTERDHVQAKNTNWIRCFICICKMCTTLNFPFKTMDCQTAGSKRYVWMHLKCAYMYRLHDYVIPHLRNPCNDSNHFILILNVIIHIVSSS